MHAESQFAASKFKESWGGGTLPDTAGVVESLQHACTRQELKITSARISETNGG